MNRVFGRSHRFCSDNALRAYRPSSSSAAGGIPSSRVEALHSAPLRPSSCGRWSPEVDRADPAPVLLEHDARVLKRAARLSLAQEGTVQVAVISLLDLGVGDQVIEAVGAADGLEVLMGRARARSCSGYHGGARDPFQPGARRSPWLILTLASPHPSPFRKRATGMMAPALPGRPGRGRSP